MMLKYDFKLFRDKSDPWGESISMLFQIAAELWWREECPTHWGYSPGAVADPREHGEGCFKDIEGSDSGDLIHFGNILDRHVRMMHHLGHSY